MTITTTSITTTIISSITITITTINTSISSITITITMTIIRLLINNLQTNLGNTQHNVRYRQFSSVFVFRMIVADIVSFPQSLSMAPMLLQPMLLQKGPIQINKQLEQIHVTNIDQKWGLS
jgi:hypothetical protein